MLEAAEAWGSAYPRDGTFSGVPHRGTVGREVLLLWAKVSYRGSLRGTETTAAAQFWDPWCNSSSDSRSCRCRDPTAAGQRGGPGGQREGGGEAGGVRNGASRSSKLVGAVSLTGAAPGTRPAVRAASQGGPAGLPSGVAPRAPSPSPVPACGSRRGALRDRGGGEARAAPPGSATRRQQRDVTAGRGGGRSPRCRRSGWRGRDARLCTEEPQGL